MGTLPCCKQNLTMTPANARNLWRTQEGQTGTSSVQAAV